MKEFIDPKLVRKRTLPNGEEIPCIGMGTFGSDRFTPDQVAEAVAGAIRCGYRLFDCAAVYGNEELIGKVFAKAFAECGCVFYALAVPQLSCARLRWRQQKSKLQAVYCG